jgi:hypothetical protein
MDERAPMNNAERCMMTRNMDRRAKRTDKQEAKIPFSKSGMTSTEKDRERNERSIESDKRKFFFRARDTFQGATTATTVYACLSICISDE